MSWVGMTSLQAIFNWGKFVPRERLAMSVDILGYHNGGVLLASSGWRPGVLLNISQCKNGSLYPSVLEKAPSVGNGWNVIPRKRENGKEPGITPPRPPKHTCAHSFCMCMHISPHAHLPSPMVSSADTYSFCIPTHFCPGK